VQGLGGPAFPRQNHAYITTDESFRFHNNKFDEMPCKVDSTENPRSFETYPNLKLPIFKTFELIPMFAQTSEFLELAEAMFIGSKTGAY